MGSGACTVAGTILAYVIARYTCRTIAGLWTMALAITGVISKLA